MRNSDSKEDRIIILKNNLIEDNKNTVKVSKSKDNYENKDISNNQRFDNINFLSKDNTQAEIKIPNQILNEDQMIYKYYTTPKLKNTKSVKIDIDIEDKISFFHKKLKHPQSMQCNIIISDDCYKAYSNQSENFMMIAYILKFKLRKNYIISANIERDNNENIIGELHANLMKNEIILYDKGIKPNENNQTEQREVFRKYLMQINKEKKGNFYQLHVYIPKEGYEFSNKSINKEDKLSNISKKENNEGIIELYSKLPEYSISKRFYIFIF